jgi:hypothetical protein
MLNDATIKVIDASILLVDDHSTSLSALAFLLPIGRPSHPSSIADLFESESEIIPLFGSLKLLEAMH